VTDQPTTGPGQTPADPEDQRLRELERITPDEILRRIHASGFTEETAVLLQLVPLVQVAWADGVVTPRERERVLRTARLRGIDERDPAWPALERWLAAPPSDAFFRQALEAIRTLLLHLSDDQRTAMRQDLLSYCTGIATASRGIFRLRRISDEEEAELELIAAELQRDHEDAVREVLDRWRRIQDSADLASFL
jgi:hypothetical protein